MKFRFPRGIYRLQSALILLVFLTFLVNAIGLIDFTNLARGGIGFNQQVWDALLSGRVAEPLLQKDCLVYFIVGLVLALALPTQSAIGASLAALVCMVPPFYVALHFPYPPPIVSLEYTLVTILVLYSVNVLCSYFIETHQRQKIMSAFGQYVPPVLVDRFSADPEAFSMEGEARELTVMFCDVRDFTTISERLDPRELVELMNRYLTVMTDILHSHGATIDKYIGDAIMAFWGAPVAQPDHAARAVAAARDMLAALPSVHEEFAQKGWPQLRVGIGINTGTMNVGNMGSNYRIAYTVLGDAVNIAARLEALTRHYRVDALISESTKLACNADAVLEIDHVRVKGKGRSIRIFEVRQQDAKDAAAEEDNAAALSAYYDGHWDDARQRFRALSERYGEPRHAVMLERMGNEAAPADFDGVISFSAGTAYALGRREQ